MKSLFWIVFICLATWPLIYIVGRAHEAGVEADLASTRIDTAISERTEAMNDKRLLEAQVKALHEENTKLIKANINLSSMVIKIQYALKGGQDALDTSCY